MELSLNATQKPRYSNCINKEQMDNTPRLLFIKPLKGAELHQGQIY